MGLYLLLYGVPSFVATCVGWYIMYRRTGGAHGFGPLWGGLGGLVAGLFVGLLLFSLLGPAQPVTGNEAAQPVTASPDTSSPAEKYQGSTVLNRSPIELINAVREGQTSVDADEISSRYIGYALAVDGVMDDLSNRFGSAVVTLDHYPLGSEDPVRIWLRFDEELLADLRAQLQIGDVVQAIGVISSVGKGSLGLEDCKLIAVVPTRG